MSSEASNSQINLNLKKSEQMPAINRSFYQRQLPESCVSFTSDEGKKLFRTALAVGHMESFFPLASQLVTQHEPSFCGLATLCTILNALGVDPKRVWKHPWRWFEQDMLDCCRSLDSIRKNGITLAEFNCLARCNGLELITRSPPPAIPMVGNEEEPEAGNGFQSLEEFRSNIARVTKSSSQFMVVSFSRASLGQTGSGHFSPIAGYSPSDDRVLVLDVARFKYPSYWVPLEDLYNSMIPIDPASGAPRGYSILAYSPFVINQTNCKKCNLPNPPSITRINLNKSSWHTLSKDLNPILQSIESDSNPLTKIRIIYNYLSKNLSHMPDPPVEIRPGLEEEQKIQISALSDQLSKLMNSLEISKDKDHHHHSDSNTTNDSHLLLLFSFAILPDHTLPSNLELSLLGPEIAYLTAQLDALGECCSIENNQNLNPNHTCKCKKSD